MNTEERKAYMREYMKARRKTPTEKAKRKMAKSTPKYKEYMRKYSKKYYRRTHKVDEKMTTSARASLAAKARWARSLRRKTYVVRCYADGFELVSKFPRYDRAAKVNEAIVRAFK